VVFRVAEEPLPDTEPLLAVQVATETETLSGLMHLADKLTVPPTGTLVGLAEIEIVGGFFGGNGLIV
jgi:hypothetical protein